MSKKTGKEDITICGLINKSNNVIRIDWFTIKLMVSVYNIFNDGENIVKEDYYAIWFARRNKIYELLLKPHVPHDVWGIIFKKFCWQTKEWGSP